MALEVSELGAFYEAAKSQYAQGNTAAAIAGFAKALELDPQHLRAHIYMGLCHLRNRDYDESIAELETALSLDPNDAWAHVSIAIPLAYRDVRRAREHFKRCREISPTYAEAYAKYAWFCRYFGTRAEKLLVEELLRKAMELEPEDADHPAALAEHLFTLKGREEDARALAEHSLALNPEGREAHVLLGHLDLMRGEGERARDHAISALAADPRSEEAVRLLMSVKSSRSRVLGLYWRAGHLLGRKHQDAARFVGLFAGMILSPAASLVGTEGVARPILLAAVGIYVVLLVYLILADVIFEALIRKELKSVNLSPRF